MRKILTLRIWLRWFKRETNQRKMMELVPGELGLVDVSKGRPGSSHHPQRGKVDGIVGKTHMKQEGDGGGKKEQQKLNLS